jgi:lipoprotein-anchoring transpeptidase ErfK/SrfK
MRGSSQASLRHTTAASFLAGLFFLSACTGSAEGKTASPASSKPASASPAPQVTAALIPANGAAGVLTSTDVIVATDGTVSSVRLTSAKGRAVTGALRPDGKTWMPSAQLEYSTRYTVRAVATKGEARREVTSTFTTMPAPSRTNIAAPYVFDGDTVGVGMPVVVEFTKDVAKAQRAAVERRLLVHATPAVEGSWYWWSDSEVHYRPKTHWKPGTKVQVRLAIGGLPMGNGNYGKRDQFVRYDIGDHLVTKVDAAAHVARVYRNDALIRTMPVSTGKASMPSSSGTHVVMEKQEEMTFDSGTFGVPANSPDGYRQKVRWDVRYTWGGEFFHSAPWSVGDQGYRNVSHGCVNLSPENAQWFFDEVKRGDLVEIVNTGRQVSGGNGWTDWNVPWAQFVKGSALYKA